MTTQNDYWEALIKKENICSTQAERFLHESILNIKVNSCYSLLLLLTY